MFTMKHVGDSAWVCVCWRVLAAGGAAGRDVHTRVLLLVPCEAGVLHTVTSADVNTTHLQPSPSTSTQHPST